MDPREWATRYDDGWLWVGIRNHAIHEACPNPLEEWGTPVFDMDTCQRCDTPIPEATYALILMMRGDWHTRR